MRRALPTAAMLAALIALGGCTSAVPDAAGDAEVIAGAASETADVRLPPAGGALDYQLGGAYEPDAAVEIVGRDRGADPAEGRYSVCYVNGFQTQPGEFDLWPEDLLLQSDGEVVFDPDWPDEALLDTSTAERRDAIVELVGPWIEGCAASGFDAVEFDNLDTFTRSDGALTIDDNLALATAFVQVAHDAGLAAGQKNAAEFAPRLRDDAGFDFAVVEECAAYDECGAYTEVYGDAVLDIEYTDALPRPYDEVCDDPATPVSVVLRDRDLTMPGDAAHVFELCEA